MTDHFFAGRLPSDAGDPSSACHGWGAGPLTGPKEPGPPRKQSVLFKRIPLETTADLLDYN